MKTLKIMLLATLGIAQLGYAQPATQPAELPVKEVVLFSSGVGYFEHFGTVEGDGSSELRFKTNQINDILKSLVLQDLDGGKIDAVTYPSQDPLAKTLKSFQVDITNNPPLADLLNQLRGAKVSLATTAGEKTQGIILGVEKHQKVIGDKNQTIEQAFLNLLTDGKIESLSMENLSSIKLDDPQLQDELNKALLALASSRDQDKKPMKISFSGQGQRHVRIGYVVETPIWKSSYRLVLGADEKKPAEGNLQGWAIVENQTDNDWNNVQLSLVSGRPISFIEDLYQPMYIPRPVMVPDLYASLRPQTYAAGGDVTLELPVPAASPASNAVAEMQLARRMAVSQKSLREGEQYAAGSTVGGFGGGGFGVNGNAPIDVLSSVRSLTTAASVGELFEFSVGNVSLARQRSAMIPIITDPIQIERLSIYNASVLPRNPLNGVRLTNTTKKHLLAGPVTVLDGSTYAGDAQIDNIPPGQERLLSYGVDLQMLVDAVNNRSDSQLQTGKIVKGVLYLTRKDVRSQEYVANNKSDHAKTLIVEHPRMANWDLVDTDKPIETTDAVYRFKQQVPAGAKSSLTVKEQIIQQQTVEILPADMGTMDYYSKAGPIPPDVQKALAKAIQLKGAVTDTQRLLDQDKQKLTDITAEQARIRENMRTVSQSSQYYTRLMTKLNDQETSIEKTQEEVDGLTKTLAAQQKDLESYLETLNVG